MNQCIYLCKENLRFEKKEHVFPAAYGGINVLPKGYVSDEINELFSKYELKIIRKSFHLAPKRIMNGPGKRGKFNIKKVKTPEILVLKDETAEIYRLGFIYVGENYFISQFMMIFDDSENTYESSFFSTFFREENAHQDILDFQIELYKFLINGSRDYTLVNLPFTTDAHFINIGTYNHKWFVCTSHKFVNVDNLAILTLPDLVEKIKNTKKEKSKITIVKKFNSRHSYEVDININFLFIYYKTVFNALAFFKGHTYILENKFDKLRKQVLYLLENEIDIDNYQHLIPHINELIIKFSNKCHYVIFKSINNILFAFISFYSEIPLVIKLCESDSNVIVPFGLICDWLNRKEYSLEDYDC